MSPEDRTIIDQALNFYEEEGRAPSILEICEIADLPEEAFFDRFNSIGDLYRTHFESTVHNAATEAMTIEGFDDQSLQDRLGALCFILLDVFDQHPRTSEDLFPIHGAGFFTPFHVALREELAEILQARNIPGVNTWFVETAVNRFLVAETIVQLIGKSLKDDSENRGRSAGLADYTVAFWAELLTSGIPDKLVSLLRYSVEAGYLPIDKIPVIGDWFKSEDE